ncbi:hypothetical protein [Glaciecola sp. 1036]|uniref:hypothetical protein n=1 Tax=Alteromonadaceae TaxID=72275 RepID=UPI003D04F6E5
MFEGQPPYFYEELVKISGAEITLVPEYRLVSRLGFSFTELMTSHPILPVLLSDTEYNIELTPRVEAGFENLGKKPFCVSALTPDSLMSGRKYLSWLALKTIRQNLLGASSSIVQTHRPLISGKIHQAELSDIEKWCHENDYLIVNNLLESVRSNVDEIFCWLFPNKKLLEQSKSYLSAGNDQINIKQTINKIVQQYYSSLTSKSDLLGQKTANLLSEGKLNFGLNDLVCIGLRELEHEQNNYWRWIAGKEARVFIPIGPKGHYKISAKIFSLAEKIKSLNLTVFINGKLHSQHPVDSGSEIQLPFYQDENYESIELLIVADQAANVEGTSLSASFSELVLHWDEDTI